MKERTTIRLLSLFVQLLEADECRPEITSVGVKFMETRPRKGDQEMLVTFPNTVDQKITFQFDPPGSKPDPREPLGIWVSSDESAFTAIELSTAVNPTTNQTEVSGWLHPAADFVQNPDDAPLTLTFKVDKKNGPDQEYIELDVQVWITGPEVAGIGMVVGETRPRS
jgi:hypothetical protein